MLIKLINKDILEYNRKHNYWTLKIFVPGGKEVKRGRGIGGTTVDRLVESGHYPDIPWAVRDYIKKTNASSEDTLTLNQFISRYEELSENILDIVKRNKLDEVEN